MLEANKRVMITRGMKKWDVFRAKREKAIQLYIATKRSQIQRHHFFYWCLVRNVFFRLYARMIGQIEKIKKANKLKWAVSLVIIKFRGQMKKRYGPDSTIDERRAYNLKSSINFSHGLISDRKIYEAKVVVNTFLSMATGEIEFNSLMEKSRDKLDYIWKRFRRQIVYQRARFQQLNAYYYEELQEYKNELALTAKK